MPLSLRAISFFAPWGCHVFVLLPETSKNEVWWHWQLLKIFLLNIYEPSLSLRSNEKSVSHKLVQKSSKVPLVPKTTFVELPSSTYPQHTCQAFAEVLSLSKSFVLKDLPPPPHPPLWLTFLLIMFICFVYTAVAFLFYICNCLRSHIYKCCGMNA